MTVKTLALMTAAAVLMQAAMAPPAVSAVVRVDRPAQADCPGVANLVLDDPDFHTDWTTGEWAERLARWHGYLGLVQIPDGSTFRPSDSASMVIRAYAPAGGMWPYIEPVNGQPSRLCPPDSSYFFAEISEAGRPRRLYVSACNNDTPTFALMNGAIYAAGDEPAE